MLRHSAIVVASLAVVTTVAAEPEAPTWERDVRPILKARCTLCHGEEDPVEAGVDLRLRRFLDREVEGAGPLLVPGDPAAGELLRVIRSGEMPKSGKEVTAEELAILERWVAAGAPAEHPEPESIPPGAYLAAEDRDWWAFRPIVRPPLPQLATPGWGRTAVDAFVRAGLDRAGLTPADEADRVTLLRRVTFDLTGLPPTPEAIDAFVADTAPDAFERVVDRLLDSPAFAERWARHWLDVAGYADSNGFAEEDSPRAHAWRYRDWVVAALAADMPWDRFIVEQLAGDELAGSTHDTVADAVADPARRAALVATGFLRLAPDGTGDTVPDQNLARNQTIAEQITIVTSSLLGLTVACAQCHDHRYDPISQVDYYRLRSIFDPVYDWQSWRPPAQRIYSLATPDERAVAAEIETRAAAIDAEARALRQRLLDEIFEKEIVKLPEPDREPYRKARATPEAERTDAQKALIRTYPSALATYSLDLYDAALEKQVADKHGEANALRATKPPEQFLVAATEVSSRVPESRLFHRGDHDQPRQPVAPGELSVLAPPGGAAFTAVPQASGSSGRRLAYARWLTGGSHPLVPRVLVNRFWLHLFGRGIVATPGDFGRLGERPSHPELLDWLASEFVAGGWRLKPFVRLLVTSAVYRQAARNDAALAADPDNRLVGRHVPRRLDAEAFRDAVLQVSGRLVADGGGPPIGIARDPVGRVVVGREEKDANGDVVKVASLGTDDFRRSIYVRVRRTTPLTVLETFDAPEMTPNCQLRRTTTVAPQALVMLNDTFVIEAARALAQRLRNEAPGDLRAQVRRGWRLLFGAEPTPGDVDRCLLHVAEQAEDLRSRQPPAPTDGSAAADPQLEALASLCQVLLATNRFLYVE